MKNTISCESFPLKKPDAAYRTILSELILLNLDNGFYYSANEVGSRLWELCDGKRPVKDLIAIISEEYEVAEEEAAGDVLEFIGDLYREGLITLQDEPEN
ncbi:MAG: PqqD family protein [Peptococcaceae bacterium]|nr:PqqD family protein [Peptococcaceae bacterium]MDH7523950.1 PqqD family protein [Peptococcaceae bacterium]